MTRLEKALLFIIMLLGLVFVLVLYDLGTAEAGQLVELSSLDLDYRNYGLVTKSTRPMLIAPEAAKEGIDLTIKATTYSYFFEEVTIETMTSETQFRGGGIIARLGLQLTPSLTVGWYHRSDHLLDRMGDRPFPFEDGLELRINVYRNYNVKPEGLF